MHLNSFSVSGFRSLTEVAAIPVRKPTILAGHNDGGKSALLDALAFLLGKHALAEDDRTYLTIDGEDESAPVRCEETSVVGSFTLDAWEQEQFDLPSRFGCAVGRERTWFLVWRSGSPFRMMSGCVTCRSTWYQL